MMWCKDATLGVLPMATKAFVPPKDVTRKKIGNFFLKKNHFFLVDLASGWGSPNFKALVQ